MIDMAAPVRLPVQIEVLGISFERRKMGSDEDIDRDKPGKMKRILIKED